MYKTEAMEENFLTTIHLVLYDKTQEIQSDI